MISETTLTALPGKTHGTGSLKNPEVRKTIALLGAFCLFLSTIEYMIPKPMPFMRIGIANLPLMLALDIFPFPTFLVLVAIKVLGQALITGTLFSNIFLFSLTGTSLAAVTMYALRRLLGPGHISFIGVGTAGAMISNVTQLALAWVFIFRASTRYIAPPFLGMGVITGILLGLFCELFVSRSRWHAARRIR
ncbi:MAG: Gx transporter family protein [Treponema sp.]|nr:Gx transporter family protein [Treponema sp.]